MRLAVVTPFHFPLQSKATVFFSAEPQEPQLVNRLHFHHILYVFLSLSQLKKESKTLLNYASDKIRETLNAI